jgi:hypothetical protein
VLPSGFPPDVARTLFVTDPDIWLWYRFPAVASGAPAPDAFLVADRPCTARTAGQWQRIVGCLHELGDGETARAIQGVVAASSARQPDEPVLVALETPEDWLERVARAEARLAAVAE